MKTIKRPVMLLLVAVGLAAVSTFAAGCNEEKQATDSQEHPASAKPKDHPAH